MKIVGEISGAAFFTPRLEFSKISRVFRGKGLGRAFNEYLASKECALRGTLYYDRIVYKDWRKLKQPATRITGRIAIYGVHVVLTGKKLI